MNKELNKLICDLIGATEVLEVAYLNGDLKSTMLALKRVEEIRNEIKKHEHYTRENDVFYE